MHGLHRDLRDKDALKALEADLFSRRLSEEQFTDVSKMITFLFLHKPYDVTIQSNRLVEAIRMNGHTII